MISFDLRSVVPPRWIYRDVAARSGIGPTRLLKVRATAYGHALVIRLNPPTSSADFERALDRLAVGFGAARCSLEVSTRSDVITLHIHSGNLAVPSAYPVDQRPIFLPRDPRESVPIGLDDYGRLVALPLLGRSLLIAGSPGSGKSNAIRCVLGAAGLSGMRHLALVGIDPKRVELTLWRDRFASLVVGNEAKPVIELLEWLVNEVQFRAAMMATQGLVDLAPSADHPALVLIVDEWAEMGADGTPKERDEATRLLRRFIALGRATGCSAVLATQRPTSEVIDTGTRALMAYRLGFRTDRHGSEAVLGSGHYEAASIGVSYPGRGYLSDSSDVQVVQVFEMPVKRIADECCPGLRLPLEGIPFGTAPSIPA